MYALEKIRKKIESGEQRIERLSTFARIAIDAGERALGVNILQQLINRYPETLSFEINDPFLPAAKAFDDIHPKGKLNEWLFSSIIEQFVLKSAFSTIFNWQKIMPLIERLRDLGFISNDLRARQDLLQRITTNA